MKLSVVTSLYYSELYIREFLSRIIEQLNRLNISDYEIICVDDGSPDESANLVKLESEVNSRVKLIQLSKNFGHYKAIMTGLRYTKGDEVFLIDCDLEEEPELLERFIKEKEQINCDVIYGVQKKRKGSVFEKITGDFFYKCSNYFCDGMITKNAVTARLMNRLYVDSLIKYNESNLMLFGLFNLVGFDQVPSIIEKHSTSKTTYTFFKKVNIVINSITSFSSYPLKFISYFGISVSLLSFFYIIKLLFNYYVNSENLLGWSSLIASIWFLGGVTIMSIGIIGIYISRIFIEVKDRPLTIIKNTKNLD